MHRKGKAPAFLCIILVLAALFGGCAAFADFATGKTVYFNEVVSSNTNSLTHELFGAPDWIEIYNPSSTAFSLGGFSLTDNIREPQRFVFPQGTSIPPGGYLLLYATKYDQPLPEGVFATGFGLSKSGETLYLIDRSMNIFAQLAIPTLVGDVSYARKSDGSYGYCATPTPGAANAGEIVDALEDIVLQSGGEGGPLLTEVLPQNATGLQAANGKRYPWAELYNDTAYVLRLRDYFLSDDETNLEKWRIDDVALHPGERVLVFFSGKKSEGGELHADFKLGSADEALYVSDAQGNVLGSLHWHAPMMADIALVYTEEGGRYCAYPTPGAQNDLRTFSELTPTQMDANDPVRINEVLPKNRYSVTDGDGERNEWVELYNQSDVEIDLQGYYLSDNGDRLNKWPLPALTMAPGEYLLVFLSGKDRAEGELHANFGLSEKDEALYLTRLDGMRVDRIPLDPNIKQNISIGRGDDGEILYYAAPTPGAKNDSKGFTSLDAVPARNADGVFISEVSAVSAAKIGKRDWIELYNPGEQSVQLAGWSLSDDIDAPQKYIFDELQISAKGHALVYAAKSGGDNTAPFNLSAAGETLFLCDPKGILRDVFQTGALRPSITAGRDEDDALGTRAFYTKATPGEKNGGEGYPGYARAPLFSNTGLYQQEAFALEMRCDTPDAKIYYTLDGSKPTNAATPYVGPIEISKNTPVRAIAYKEGLLASEVTNSTYLFEEPHSLPVLCINADPGDISSVYAATTKPERVEREAYGAYYEAPGLLGVEFPCGLRASGASTLTAAQKSFTLYFRGGYGRSSVTYPFFEGYSIDTFSSLTIRNSGQDRGRARVRDSFVSLAAQGLKIDNAATRPIVMYLNGAYWGIYDLNENQNEDYLVSHYGVERDAVDIIRRNISTLAGSNRDIKRIQSYGRTQDFSDPAVYEAYCEWVDMDYLIDYLIVQTFFANGDIFNQKYWRSQDYSVKWRPVLFDLDFAFSGGPTRNILGQYFRYDGVPSQDGSITNMDMYCGLRASHIWCERFVARYVDVVINHLSTQRLGTLLDSHAAALRPEMERHIRRWKTPGSLSAWESAIAALRETATARPSYALRYVQSYFNVSDAKMEEYKRQATENPW